MTKTNTTNNATVNTNINASKTSVKQPIPTMSKETMQSKTNKELRDYIDTYFTDNVLARFGFTRPNDRAKKADLILFISDLYNAIATAKKREHRPPRLPRPRNLHLLKSPFPRKRPQHPQRPKRKTRLSL